MRYNWHGHWRSLPKISQIFLVWDQTVLLFQRFTLWHCRALNSDNTLKPGTSTTLKYELLLWTINLCFQDNVPSTALIEWVPMCWYISYISWYISYICQQQRFQRVWNGCLWVSGSVFMFSKCRMPLENFNEFFSFSASVPLYKIPSKDNYHSLPFLNPVVL